MAGCKRLPEPAHNMPQQMQQQMHRPMETTMMRNSPTPPAMATMNLHTWEEPLVRSGWKSTSHTRTHTRKRTHTHTHTCKAIVSQTSGFGP